MSSSTSTTADDNLEIARGAIRDKSSRERLFSSLEQKIQQVVYSVLRSGKHASDVRQTVALEILESLGKYNGSGALDAWAGAVAYRVSKKSLRRQSKWESRHICYTDPLGEVYENPETKALRRELMTALNKKMAKMSKKKREPVLLHVVQGYTVSEISKIMNVSPNTTKERLKCGLRELRKTAERNPSLKEIMLELIGNEPAGLPFYSST